MLWALTDHLNTVRDLASYNASTDQTTIANHRVYDAFGNLKSETNSAVDCLFGFTGRLFDEDTGLQNNLNRWYDPEVGRWLSEDPIGYGGGDLNLYRYVNNSSLIYTDPEGTGPVALIKCLWNLNDWIDKIKDEQKKCEEEINEGSKADKCFRDHFRDADDQMKRNKCRLKGLSLSAAALKACLKASAKLK